MYIFMFESEILNTKYKKSNLAKKYEILNHPNDAISRKIEYKIRHVWNYYLVRPKKNIYNDNENNI